MSMRDPAPSSSRISTPKLIATLGNVALRSNFSNMPDEDLRDLGKTGAFEIDFGVGECAA